MASPSTSASQAHLKAAANASRRLTNLLPGLVVCTGLAAAGISLGHVGWLQAHGFGAFTLAIVLGMLAGNTVYTDYASTCGAGVNYSKQSLLRLGVILYGLRLTVQDIGHVGITGVLIDALVLASTFSLACFIGTRWLGMDRKTAMLIGAGSSICGAAAVMATEPVVRGKAEQVTVAVGTVVVFGTAAIFVYPMLFDLNRHWQIIPGGATGFGIYVGSTVHEVAQVVAAAHLAAPTVANSAVIAKMVRVIMLAPFLVLLSGWLARDDKSSHAQNGEHSTAKVTLPWFAFMFIGVVLFNSLHLLSPDLIALMTDIDTVLLAMAMAALGLSTHLTAIRKAGGAPLLLALILFVWLVIGGALINRCVYALLG